MRFFFVKPQRALIFHLPEYEEQWSASAPLDIAFESLPPISSLTAGLGPVTEVDSG